MSLWYLTNYWEAKLLKQQTDQLKLLQVSPNQFKEGIGESQHSRTANVTQAIFYYGVTFARNDITWTKSKCASIDKLRQVFYLFIFKNLPFLS